MIDEIVESYAHVAGLAKRAGFEMLMIHGGHGWLINQFLSPMFNHRTDEYGGTLENRCRFAVEVLKAVRLAVGPFFPLEFRMSGSEMVPEGYGLEDGVEIARSRSSPTWTSSMSPPVHIRRHSEIHILPCSRITDAMSALLQKSKSM